MKDTGGLTAHVRQLARDLPADTLGAVIGVLYGMTAVSDEGARARLMAAIPTARCRNTMTKLLRSWEGAARPTSGSAVALALESTRDALKHEEAGESVDLVWTGPSTPAVPVRRTEQALLELIGDAQQELWIVSFAVHRIAAVLRELRSAVDRHVAVGLILESVEASEGRLSFDQIAGIRAALSPAAAVYEWPADQRLRNEDGRYGLLHAKFALADQRSLLVSSANLTEFALTLNMELGVRIEGGRVPPRLTRHLRELIDRGVLRRL
jgi:phosphatidylserine/phosphatidylglycerophosphate/cardiolipin synthase-like enzyme